MYGLPKTQKPNLPLRPIVSSVNTPQYKLAKFIISDIMHAAKNEYTLENSKDLIDSTSNMNIPDSYFMASFDVESLYTDIPLKETIDIIVNSIYDNDDMVRNIHKYDFKKLLELVTEDSFIIFNNKFIEQKDGLAMGSPVCAVSAHIFMSHHKKKWLELCHARCKPTLYRRYVDDTYLIFKSQTNVEPFFNYLNRQRRKINSTLGQEMERRIPFLDIMIDRNSGKHDFSAFRKPTFTG